MTALHRESKDMSRLCEEMAEYFRGLMLIKTMKDASRLVLCSPQELGGDDRPGVGLEPFHHPPRAGHL